MGNLREQHYTLMITPRSIPLITRNVSEKSLRENQNINIMLTNIFSPKIMPFIRWKNVAQPVRPQMTNEAHAHCMLNT